MAEMIYKQCTVKASKSVSDHNSAVIPASNAREACTHLSKRAVIFFNLNHFQ